MVTLVRRCDVEVVTPTEIPKRYLRLFRVCYTPLVKDHIKRIEQLLRKYIFASSEIDYGRTDKTYYRIDTGPARSIK